MTTTITTLQGHGIQTGDCVSVMVPDARWHRRLWHWLLRRGKPMRPVRFQVSSGSGTTVNLEKP